MICENNVNIVELRVRRVGRASAIKRQAAGNYHYIDLKKYARGKLSFCHAARSGSLAGSLPRATLRYRARQIGGQRLARPKKHFRARGGYRLLVGSRAAYASKKIYAKIGSSLACYKSRLTVLASSGHHLVRAWRAVLKLPRKIRRRRFRRMRRLKRKMRLWSRRKVKARRSRTPWKYFIVRMASPVYHYF